MFNEVTLLGNLGRDPEIKTTKNGNRVALLNMATSEYWRDKQSGDRREHTEWHRVVVWNENLIDVAEKYLRKGSKILIVGSLTTRKWEDKDGTDRWTTEIKLGPFNSTLKMLDKKPSDDNGEDPAAPPKTTSGGRADLDDEIPF